MASIIKVDTIQTAAGGTPTAADLGLNTTGSVLQVVQSVFTGGSIASTSASWTDTGLEATITPKSSDSTILVQYIGTHRLDSSNSRIRGGGRVVRGSTTVAGGTGTESMQIRMNADVIQEYGAFVCISRFDSPNTTSSVTYKYQYYVNDGQVIRFIDQYDNTLTLMEIAG